MVKILLVEDNEMNRDMLSRRLERKGYAVVCAVDGVQAVTMAQSEQPELILMDMSLPGLDGWEATRQIKAADKTMPIIALTAHAMDSDEQRAREAGCDDFDTKPVEMARLLEKIEAQLARNQGSRSNRRQDQAPGAAATRRRQPGGWIFPASATSCARPSTISLATAKCCWKGNHCRPCSWRTCGASTPVAGNCRR